MVGSLPFVFLLGVSLAAPLVTFPINSQVPPVARVAQPYTFEFSLRTFTSSDNSDLTYSLQDAPSWLSLHAASRTLSGTPNESDAGPLTFKISAKDGEGTVSTDVTLVVVNGTATEPEPESDVLRQLNEFGEVIAADTISVHAGDSIDLPFGSESFTGAESQYYYATSGDRSPLPSWLAFDSATVTFSGVAPPQISYPQNFPILIIASTVKGFAEAAIPFNLVISEHQLAFKPYEQEVHVAQGDNVSFTKLRNELYLDGSLIDDSDLQSAAADVPSWFKFDQNSFAISGTFPSGVMSRDVIVQAHDVYGNTASALVHFQSGTGIVKPTTTFSTTSPPATSTGSAGGGGLATPSQGSYSSHGTTTPGELGKGGLAAVIVFPILLLIVLVAILFFCCFRSSRPDPTRKQDGKKGTNLFNTTQQISARIGAAVRGKSKPETDLEKHTAELMKGPRVVVDSRAPLPPPIPLRSPHRVSDGSVLDPRSLALLDAHRRSIGFGQETHLMPHDSMRLPKLMARRRTGSRNNRRSSHASRRSAGLPVERRLTGIGHGRPLPGLVDGRSNSGIQKRARTRCSPSMSSRSIESFSSLQDSVPGLYSLTRTRMHPPVTEDAKRNSIRLVDSRPFEEKRRSYIRRRASSAHWSPLFAAGAGPSRKLSTSQSHVTESVHLSPAKARAVHVQDVPDSPTRQSHSPQVQNTLEDEWSGSNWETSASNSSHSANRKSKGAKQPGTDADARRESKQQNWSRKLSRDTSDPRPMSSESVDYNTGRTGTWSSSNSLKPSASKREPLSSVQNEARPISWLERIGKRNVVAGGQSSSVFGNEAFM